MQKKMTDVILLNLKVFFISVFILYLVSCNMALFSHDARLKEFEVVYLAFTASHALLNFLLSYL